MDLGDARRFCTWESLDNTLLCIGDLTSNADAKTYSWSITLTDNGALNDRNGKTASKKYTLDLTVLRKQVIVLVLYYS